MERFHVDGPDWRKKYRTFENFIKLTLIKFHVPTILAWNASRLLKTWLKYCYIFVWGFAVSGYRNVRSLSRALCLAVRCCNALINHAGRLLIPSRNIVTHDWCSHQKNSCTCNASRFAYRVFKIFLDFIEDSDVLLKFRLVKEGGYPKEGGKFGEHIL